MEVTEGGVTVEVPEQADAGVGEAVFFNPAMELNRDVTVATLRAYRSSEPRGATSGSAAEDASGADRPREPRAERYLDATAATGIRGVRAAADGWDVTLADVDADAVERCRANLARNGLDGEVVHRDANSLLHDRDRVFDVVDVDPFGTPIPFADAAFANARDLVCVTATDTAPLCGAHLQSGIRKYDARPRNTEYHAEMGLRVLVSALVRTAARYDVAANPILSHVSDHYVRTYLDLDRGATAANEALDDLGFVYHCPECLWRRAERGFFADEPEGCPACGGDNVITAGRLWLGPAHDRAFVAAVRDRVTDDAGTATRARRLLGRIETELHVPTHYDQHRLTDRWEEPAIAMDEFLDCLRAAGFEASRTHYGGTTFKTTADVDQIEHATRHAR